MFVDRVALHLRSGDGGAGVASFRKVRGRPKGKPEGGNGGQGGDVIIEADLAVATLLRYRRRPHHRAGDATHGQGNLRHGRRGDDLILPVPPGTEIRDEGGELLADLVLPGQRVKVLEGGHGGLGNAALVGPHRRAPAFAEQGEFGEEATLLLELRLVADAALVGLPNAGKSTLISRVSAARPKVADYPFTTLEPHLGVVTADDREFVMADVPGLIEGAAEGKGLGHEFLRHVERATVLVLLLDPSPLQETSIEDQHRILLSELREHAPELSDRPRVVAVTKADLEEELGDLSRLAEPEVHVISSLTGEGVAALVHAIADRVAAHQPIQRPGYVLHRPLRSLFTIRRDGDAWIVEGRAAERAVALSDLTIPEVADLAAERIRRVGVEEALRRRGAQPGDEVRIGDLTFEFWEEEQGE